MNQVMCLCITQWAQSVDKYSQKYSKSRGVVVRYMSGVLCLFLYV